MADEHESAWGPESCDADLITAVRLGDTGAFDVLYRRHANAARTVASQYLHSTGEADDAVADAFTKVLAILTEGGGPDIAFRAYLFTVVRRRAFEMVNGSRRTQPTDDVAAFESAFGPLASTEEPALQDFERTTVAQAFRSLPERWQSILWYSEVEGLAPAAIAPILGLTANGAAALAYRAREGLREAYLQQHLTSAPADECQKANALLGSFVRGGLAKRETAVVEHHLEDCGECRALVLELGDVSHGMRAVIAPLVLGLAGIGLVGTALPTWGAAVATSTGLAAGGTAAAGASAGGAGSSGAAGGTAATGASGAGSAGGLGAMLSGIPALVVGLAAVVVVAAGFGVAALLGLVGDDDTRSAEPVTAGSTPDPSDGTTTGTDDDAAAGSDPSLDPTTDVTTDPSTDPTSPTTVTEPSGAPDDGRAPDSRDPGDLDPAEDGTPGSRGTDPTAPGGTTPASPAPVDPTPVIPAPVVPTPVVPVPVVPDPPVVSFDLGLELASGTTLVARQNNTLALSLSNAGLDLVSDVAVELTIPSGLAFVPGVPLTSGVFGPRVLLADSGDWVCVGGTDADTLGSTIVRCEVAEVSAGASTDLTLDVYVDSAEPSVTIAAQVFVGAEPVGAATMMRSRISLAPAQLEVGVVPVAELVAGRPGHLAVRVSNVGQMTAAGTTVELPLSPDSGLTWRGGAGVLSPAAGSDSDWTCSASDVSGQDVASCTHTTGVPGDSSSTVVLPVAVAAGSTFDGVVAPVVGHAGVPGATGMPQPVTVVARGLSATDLLEGPLQTAQVSAAVGEPAMLAVPAGATVRRAELVWSGSDADGASATTLASVELRGEAGGLGVRSMAGTAVTVDAPGAGGQGYWAASDVTSMLADHATSGRWLVAPLPGASAPADLRWTLTVVYDVAGQPDATVALLSGPPAPGAAQAERTVTLPADKSVTVAATGTSRGPAPSLVANGRTLTAPTGTDVHTYRSHGLVPEAAETRAPFALSLTVPSGGAGSGAFDTLAVHASPDRAAAGALDQREGLVQPSVVLDPVAPSADGDWDTIAVRNAGGLPVTSVHVTFAIPPGLVTVTGPVDGSACTEVRQGAPRITCVVAPLLPGQSALLPLQLRAPAGQIDLTYTLSALDPLTGVPFLSDGVIVRADP